MTSPGDDAGPVEPGEVAGRLALPEPGEVQVWWARIDPGNLTEATRERLAGDLDAERRAKLARFVQAADRDRGLAAHALLRRVLAAMTGAAPARLRFAVHCAACESHEHGKPYLVRDDGGPVPEFNLSHSGPVVAVGLTTGRAIGVDVEAARRVDWTSLRRSVFADSEWRATEDAPDADALRTQLWSRKEAAVKASGHGLSLPLKGLVVHGDPGTGPAVGAGAAWSARLPEGAGVAWGRDLGLGAGIGGAVAAHGRSLDEADPIAVLSVLFVTV